MVTTEYKDIPELQEGDNVTLHDLLVQLKKLGIGFKAKSNKEDGLKLIPDLLNTRAVKVYSAFNGEIDSFLICLSERTYDLKHVDQYVIQYHIDMGFYELGQAVYDELSNGVENIIIFRNYVLFVDYLLKEKGNFPKQRQELRKVYNNAYQEIYLLKEYVKGIKGFFKGAMIYG